MYCGTLMTDHFNFNGQKSGRSRAVYGHWPSPVFLRLWATVLLFYKFDVTDLRR